MRRFVYIPLTEEIPRLRHGRRVGAVPLEARPRSPCCTALATLHLPRPAIPLPAGARRRLQRRLDFPGRLSNGRCHAGRRGRVRGGRVLRCDRQNGAISLRRIPLPRHGHRPSHRPRRRGPWPCRRQQHTELTPTTSRPTTPTASPSFPTSLPRTRSIASGSTRPPAD